MFLRGTVYFYRSSIAFQGQSNHPRTGVNPSPLSRAEVNGAVAIKVSIIACRSLILQDVWKRLAGYLRSDCVLGSDQSMIRSVDKTHGSQSLVKGCNA